MTKRLEFTLSGFIPLPDDGLDTMTDVSRMLRELRDKANELSAGELKLNGIAVETHVRNQRNPAKVGTAAVAKALKPGA